MVKYGNNIVFNPEKLDKYNIDRQSVLLIPEKSRVLEIGCATGFVGEYLIANKKCQVIGVELSDEEALVAKKRLTGLIKGDIEDKATIVEIKKLGKFDVVYASALVEHLKDPWTALKTWRKFLKKDGCLILSTSNIAHWSMRIKLLQGNFIYEQYGILDNTHLRFFTTKTFQELFRQTGYVIEHFAIDAVGGGYPKISKFLSRFYPNVFAYQMVVKATPNK